MTHPTPTPERSSLPELPDDHRALIDAAVEARARARATYSSYRVGAAVLDEQGCVHLGCNVEISSYSLTLCAERVALFAAVAAGATRINAIAVAGPGRGNAPTPPCGACRQVIWDLAPDAVVLIASPDDQVEIWRPEQLLPAPFGPEHLEAES